MKVLIGWYPDDGERARVRNALPPDCELVLPAGQARFSRFETSLDDISAAIESVDAILTWVVPPGAIERAERLRMLAWMHTGVDILPLDLLRARGIRLSNISGGNSVAVVEHAMVLLLGLSKRIVDLHRSAIEGELRPLWHPDYSTTLVQSKTLLIIGLGNIGAEIARRAKAFDMRVIGIRNNPDRPCEHVDCVHGADELLAVLPSADYIMLAAPLTPSTHNMIGQAELAVMKSSAYLINIGRAHLVDELPLYGALTSGRLAGFASDVWWNYPHANPCTYHFPVPSRTGLHKLPNVLPTSDQAANVIEIKDVEIDMATQSIAAFINNEPVPREIDLELGY